VPTLILRLRDEKEDHVRFWVKIALKRIDPEAAKRAGVP
jgi:hypothetical protein